MNETLLLLWFLFDDSEPVRTSLGHDVLCFLFALLSIVGLLMLAWKFSKKGK